MTSPWGIDLAAPAANHKRTSAPPVSSEILRLIERRYPVWDSDSVAHIFVDIATILTGVMVMTGIREDKQDEFFDVLKEKIKLLRSDFEDFAKEFEG